MAPAWYDVAWNPIAGCSSAGPGCDHCDAMRIVAQLVRIGGKGGARYAGLARQGKSGPKWSGELRVRGDLLTWPLVQRKARRILVASLSDLFHQDLATETVDAVHAVMQLAHWHRFLVQTRRAERMRAYYTDPQTPQRVAAQIEGLANRVVPARRYGAGARGGDAGVAAEPDRPALARWPLPNLWLGVSVEDQQRASRIGELLRTPAALRWACCEPLLGPLQTDRLGLADGSFVDALSGDCFGIGEHGRMQPTGRPALPRLDWVIAGGEIGVAARPISPDWVRDLRDRCALAGVRFFFKQWGEWGAAPGDARGEKMVRCGRRTAGRLIDGRSWDEMPPAARPRAQKQR